MYILPTILPSSGLPLIMHVVLMILSLVFLYGFGESLVLASRIWLDSTFLETNFSSKISQSGGTDIEMNQSYLSMIWMFIRENILAILKSGVTAMRSLWKSKAHQDSPGLKSLSSHHNIVLLRYGKMTKNQEMLLIAALYKYRKQLERVSCLLILLSASADLLIVITGIWMILEWMK